jgi:hypothetical protein
MGWFLVWGWGRNDEVLDQVHDGGRDDKVLVEVQDEYIPRSAGPFS